MPLMIHAQVCYQTNVYYEKVAIGCGSTSSSSSNGGSSSSTSTSSSSSNGGSSTSTSSSSGRGSSGHGTSQYPPDVKLGKKYIAFTFRERVRTDILPPRFLIPKVLTDVGLTDYFTNDKILGELWRRKGVWSLIDKTVEYQPPKWVEYNKWNNRSDLDFWRYKLPQEDHNRYMYIIIPTAGIVAPISEMPQNDDFKSYFRKKNIIEGLSPSWCTPLSS